MIAEVRIYTANRPQNEFVWIRVFENEAERDAKIESSFASPERKAIGDLPQSLLAKTEVRTVEDAFAPATLAREVCARKLAGRLEPRARRASPPQTRPERRNVPAHTP